LKEKVLNAYPHILVQAKSGTNKVVEQPHISEVIGKTKEVTRVFPYVQNEMILRSERRSVGAVVWGLPVSSLRDLKFSLSEGGWPDQEATIPQAIIGSELAYRVGLVSGDKFTLISPLKKEGALGLVPQSQVFQVSGVFSSGHYEFDEQYVILGLEDAQDLLGWENFITGWQVWVNKLEKTSEIAEWIQSGLPGELEVKSWESFNSALFQSLKLEQYSMFIILSFAILIAVMNIVITLTMNVVHKRKNIGILRALGATSQQIRSVFLWQGLLTGAVGLFIGALLMVLFVVYVKYFSHYQLPEIYYDRTLPIEIRPVSLMLVYLVATIFVYVATLVPSAQASKLSIIESIRE